MACYARPARLPVGQGLDLNQLTKCDGQTKNRTYKPQKGNDKISSKNQRRQQVVLGHHLIGLQETLYKLTDLIFQSQYQEMN
jgi:hypothetical protein